MSDWNAIADIDYFHLYNFSVACNFLNCHLGWAQTFQTWSLSEGVICVCVRLRGRGKLFSILNTKGEWKDKYISLIRKKSCNFF